MAWGIENGVDEETRDSGKNVIWDEWFEINKSSEDMTWKSHGVECCVHTYTCNGHIQKWPIHTRSSSFLFQIEFQRCLVYSKN